MYCVKCGVELRAGTEKCPLCGTPVWTGGGEPAEPAPYPPYTEPLENVRPNGLPLLLSILAAIPLILCLVIDLRLNRSIVWSGFVAGGLLVGYCVFCLPLWFRRRNPVIFVPVDLAAALALCLYICLKTGGHWFLSLAFPVGGGLLLILETVIVLLRYAVGTHRHRRLFILGGASVALGGLCLLTEFMIRVSFGTAMRWWSLFPLSAMSLLGLFLILAGICRPLRRSLHKMFFL